jgi:hypothetical protein
MAARLGILWRGDPAEPAPPPESTRLHRVFEEFAALGVVVEPIVYADEAAEAIRDRLLALDGVLVWVDPISEGRDRSVLDPLLREVASCGVFVSAHPDVILKMGTKDVLYRTREMPWGTDTRLYLTAEELLEQLPAALRNAGSRVLKQHRGNGGNGVWKVELVRDAAEALHMLVRVQHGVRGAQVEEMRLGDLVERCGQYFARTGCIIDQPYVTRLADGMIRCYMTHDRVVGFGHQFVTALLPPEPGASGPPDPPARLYYGPSKEEFQPLKRLLETGWIAEMQRLLDIDRASLPVIWDADFLLGPRDGSGKDTYVLCEINVSSVFPVPDEAFAPLVRAAIDRVSG